MLKQPKKGGLGESVQRNLEKAKPLICNNDYGDRVSQ